MFCLSREDHRILQGAYEIKAFCSFVLLVKYFYSIKYDIYGNS